MHPTRSKRRAGDARSAWRVRAVQLALALAGTGLMTAIATAAIGAKQGPANGDAMTSLLLAQQVASGVAPQAPATAPPAAAPTSTPPSASADATARAEILAEAATIELKLHQSLDHTEKLRTAAFKAKDMIRLNAITAKLTDMKQIMAIAEGALAVLREPGQDLFVMRAKLSTLRQGLDGMKEAEAAAESSEGGDVNSVNGAMSTPAETGTNTGETDPSNLGTPGLDNTPLPRPSQASPYL
jgi:hypothetical protein